MKYGKTIKIFLIDGDPNGRMTCELSNWTGKSANGLTEWRVNSGLNLRDYET